MPSPYEGPPTSHRKAHELWRTRAQNHLCRRLRPIEHIFDDVAHRRVAIQNTRTSVERQRLRGSRRPAPCLRSSGTSVSAHSASQMSRAGTPASSASSAVRPANWVSTRSLTSDCPRPPNSVSTARSNSLRRIEEQSRDQRSVSCGSIDATRTSGGTAGGGKEHPPPPNLNCA